MPNKDEDASQRTDLAQDRTLLANERTFAGWVRTGMTAVGIGVGFQVLFQSMEPAWVPKSIATLFLLLGVGVVIAAERRACRVRDKLHAHVVAAAEPMNLRLVTIGMAVGSLTLIAALWLVPMRQAFN